MKSVCIALIKAYANMICNSEDKNVFIVVNTYVLHLMKRSLINWTRIDNFDYTLHLEDTVTFS